MVSIKYDSTVTCFYRDSKMRTETKPRQVLILSMNSSVAFDIINCLLQCYIRFL